jgi:hypothetical protein
MVNASVSPSASAAVGVKVYGADAFTDAVGVPEIVGAWLAEPGGGVGAGGCAVPVAGVEPSSPPPQPLSAAAHKTININPGPSLRMTITPVGGNPAILEIRVSVGPEALRPRLSAGLPLHEIYSAG